VEGGEGAIEAAGRRGGSSREKGARKRRDKSEGGERPSPRGGKGRRAREGAAGGRRITETEREIDVEGLSTTDKYYIRAGNGDARRPRRSVGARGNTQHVHHANATVSLIF